MAAVLDVVYFNVPESIPLVDVVNMMHSVAVKYDVTVLATYEEIPIVVYPTCDSSEVCKYHAIYQSYRQRQINLNEAGGFRA